MTCQSNDSPSMHFKETSRTKTVKKTLVLQEILKNSKSDECTFVTTRHLKAVQKSVGS